MALPAESRFDFTNDLQICRVINGMWQVSGQHGRIDPKAALYDMTDYHDAGFTTWDLADHYGPAEDFIGEFRQQLRADRGEDALTDVQAFTKWVPQPGPMSRQLVEENIDLSLERMKIDRLDLLQFHWGDYQDDNYLEALKHLADLQAAGKIRYLGLTNFDTEHLAQIVQAGIPIVSNQVQFSLVDQRPEKEMIPFCQANNIHLLAYGTLCGGLISEKYLGRPEPGSITLKTASLQKYKQMIEMWGNWTLFQSLIETLQDVADKHKVSIANVASRYILDKPVVAGVIIGARLGVTYHADDNVAVFSFSLDEADLLAIDEVMFGSRDLFQLIGDCGAEYRP